jgi:hypothetical protein
MGRIAELGTAFAAPVSFPSVLPRAQAMSAKKSARKSRPKVRADADKTDTTAATPKPSGKVNGADDVFAEQAEALSELHWLYSQAALWGKPRRFEHVTFHKGDDGGLRELSREAMHAHLEASRRIEAAKRKLLATGFAVPDSWLTVRAVGSAGMKWETLEPPAGRKKPTGKPQYRVTLTDAGVDIEGLRNVCEQMYVAELRLGMRADARAANAVKKAGVLPDPTAALPPGDWSRPMPLKALADRIMKDPSKTRKLKSVYGNRLVQMRRKSWTIRLDGLPRNIVKEINRP